MECSKRCELRDRLSLKDCPHNVHVYHERRDGLGATLIGDSSALPSVLNAERILAGCVIMSVV